jgi:putative intracellular protease/amidase
MNQPLQRTTDATPDASGTPAPKTVHMAVYDTLADWEPGHTIAELTQHGYRVLTVALTDGPVTTMGGVRILPHLTLDQLRPEDSALLLLPGAEAWDGADLDAFAKAARAFLDAGVPVAAICGAVFGLAREGLLDERPHTGAAPEALEASGYRGGAHYRDTDAVTSGDLITAGPTDPEAFAREIFARLGVLAPEVLDAWFRLFAHSDASAYPVLAAAAEAGAAGGE